MPLLLQSENYALTILPEQELLRGPFWPSFAKCYGGKKGFLMGKIYTRTGDKGKTGLYGGRRDRNDDVRVEAYGTIDELNSAIGAVLSEVRSAKFEVRNELRKIQGDLFEIGAVLATPQRVRRKEKRVHEEFGKHLQKRALEFERLIDKLTEKLPPLRNFILPGGSKEGATLHLARSICRRAERRIVTLSHKEDVHEGIVVYMNRLSDLLFTMARFVNKQKRIPETPWKGLK